MSLPPVPLPPTTDRICATFSFDVAVWIRTHLEAERAKAAAREGGLKIAGAGGEGRQGDTIGVVLSVDKDEETARAERDREAAAKRQQNALPLWHLQSTISGDLTALGIKESARAEAAAVADANRLPSSNDAILKGLGGGAANDGPLASSMNGEDVKPNIAQTAEADCEHLSDRSFLSRLTLVQITISITHLSRLLQLHLDCRRRG